MKKILLVSICSVIAIDVSAQSSFFDNNWQAKVFSIPTTNTVVALPTTGTATTTITLNLVDTLGKVLPTQLGTNTTFRSSSASSNILNRIPLYKSSGMGTYRYPAGSGSNIFFWNGVAPQNTKQYLDVQIRLD